MAPVSASDVIVHPPTVETVPSPGGSFEVEIRLPANAGPHAATSTATLYRVEVGERHRVWERKLEHRPRPRFASVSDVGQVVLWDEWLNIRSDRAITLIGRDGDLIVQYDLSAVQDVLGRPAAALTASAKYGPWMQSLPRVSADGKDYEVDAGGRTLVLSLPDGALSVR